VLARWAPDTELGRGIGHLRPREWPGCAGRSRAAWSGEPAASHADHPGPGGRLLRGGRVAGPAQRPSPELSRTGPQPGPMPLAVTVTEPTVYKVLASSWEEYSDLRVCGRRVGGGDGRPANVPQPLPSAAILAGVRCLSSQTPPRGLARFILLLDVRGGGLR